MRLVWLTAVLALASALLPAAVLAQLQVGYGEAKIDPDVSGPRPVWLAGFGHGRRATGTHDPLMVRCVVLKHGEKRIALVSVDLIGLQYGSVQQIRSQLPEYHYVLVASTHNHEGPDVIGIWGSSPFRRGVDDDYLELVVQRSVRAVRSAEQQLTESKVEFGTAQDESLLGDSREPYVKDGVLRTLRFVRTSDGKPVCGLVQWNCHPESLGSRNTLITADFPHYTVAALQSSTGCPVIYFSGAIGGLMSNPDGKFRDAQGEAIPDGNFDYAKIYGEAVAELARRAFTNGTPVNLTPFGVSAKPIAVPVENRLYRAARELGVLKREARRWTGNYEQAGEVAEPDATQGTFAVVSEVAYLRLGEVDVACIPGELYPELVYGQIQDPPDAGADFPQAPKEPSVASLLPSSKWLLIGLANDELGYIIPQRQWDEAAPYCYGRTRAPYGEVNSCGPLVAPIMMGALAKCVAETARSGIR